MATKPVSEQLYKPLVDSKALKLAVDALENTRREAAGHVKHAVRKAVKELLECDYDTVAADPEKAEILKTIESQLRSQFEGRLEGSLQILRRGMSAD